MNTSPASGRFDEAASDAFANAIAKFVSIPITSPVDFISGPKIVSTPGNLPNGNTDSLTATCDGTRSVVNPISRSVFPAITNAAYFASGTQIALLTNGILRDARGFTSRM